MKVQFAVSMHFAPTLSYVRMMAMDTNTRVLEIQLHVWATGEDHEQEYYATPIIFFSFETRRLVMNKGHNLYVVSLSKWNDLALALWLLVDA